MTGGFRGAARQRPAARRGGPRRAAPPPHKVPEQVTGANCQQAAEELERYLDAGLTATRELLAAFLNDLNTSAWLDGAPAVTAAGQPAFRHHPTRTTRAAAAPKG
jgi:hypothetical protein